MKPPELVPNWDEPAWGPLREAWDQRGLEYPPTAGQRSRMWPMVREFGQKIHDWVAGQDVGHDLERRRGLMGGLHAPRGSEPGRSCSRP
jgi:hypothetical protein